MASFYFPMTLSYAENLGHIPPINGLYSFVFNPFIYAILGSCPQMVVGPEAAGSLLLGHVVKSSVEGGLSEEEDMIMHAMIGGLVTAIAGAIIFIAGLTRLGFLDGILSRPFLRGFISAIGFVILVDQLIPEMGLAGRAKKVGHVSHGSSIDKLIFLVENVQYTHGLTCGVAFGSFAIIMVLRYIFLLRWKYSHFANMLIIERSRRDCSLDTHLWLTFLIVLLWCYYLLSFLGNFAGINMDSKFLEKSNPAQDHL